MGKWAYVYRWAILYWHNKILCDNLSPRAYISKNAHNNKTLYPIYPYITLWLVPNRVYPFSWYLPFSLFERHNFIGIRALFTQIWEEWLSQKKLLKQVKEFKFNIKKIKNAIYFSLSFFTCKNGVFFRLCNAVSLNIGEKLDLISESPIVSRF